MNTAKDDGVHRLVDMVVEEVSLVDRAANKHRFLIVKRDDTMDEDTVTEVTTETLEAADLNADGGGVDDDSPLGAAVAALESLTDIVELLSTLGGDSTDPRLADLSVQLRATAEQLLARAGVSSDEDAEPVEGRAKAAEEPEAAAPAPTPLKANVAAAKAAVQRLTAHRATQAQPAPSAPTTPPGPSPDVAAMTKGLSSLAASFRTLSDTVKEQQQRLGRMEKQFGLPNSAAPAERVAKAVPDETGWPLDLNKPMDRENVDKTVSFHDL